MVRNQSGLRNSMRGRVAQLCACVSWQSRALAESKIVVTPACTCYGLRSAAARCSRASVNRDRSSVSRRFPVYARSRRRCIRSSH